MQNMNQVESKFYNNENKETLQEYNMNFYNLSHIIEESLTKLQQRRMLHGIEIVQ